MRPTHWPAPHPAPATPLNRQLTRLGKSSGKLLSAADVNSNNNGAGFNLFGGEGGGNTDRLDISPPATWDDFDALGADDNEMIMVEVPDGPERAAAIAAFMKTLHPNVQVHSLKRVQNLSMWQSYAVYRHSVLSREGNTPAAQKR